MNLVAACILVTLGAPSAGSLAQDEKRLEELEARVEELERKLERLEEFLEKLFTQGPPEIQKATKKAIQRAKITSCANNLSQLWKMQAIYQSQFGGRMKEMPKETGPAFWLALTKTEPPLIEEEFLDIFVCPASGKDPAVGFTSYRGPARRVGLLEFGDPVGCCTPGSHPDGTITVLRKSGDVVVVGPDDPLYKQALKGTRGPAEEK